MIEVIYKEAKKEAEGNEQYFEMPKNIRQIGEPAGKFRIYLEDYVHTYLKQLKERGQDKDWAGLLLGQVNWLDGVTYLFIKSACCLEAMKVSAAHITFGTEDWDNLGKIQKKYFEGQEILGWFALVADEQGQMPDTLYHTHLESFGGSDKVVLLMNTREREENFYRYENGSMVCQKGYYIYYEKNPRMQEYMIAFWGNQPMESKKEVSDRAVVDFRQRTIRQEEKKQKKSSAFLYGMSAALTMLCLGIGVSYLNSYRVMKNTTEKVLETAAQATEQEDEQIPRTDDVPKTTPQPPVITEKPKVEDSQAEKSDAVPEEIETEPTEQTVNSTGHLYTVQVGDTLNKISQQIYGNIEIVSQICQLNNMQSDDIIYPGQIILLP